MDTPASAVEVAYSAAGAGDPAYPHDIPLSINELQSFYLTGLHY